MKYGPPFDRDLFRFFRLMRTLRQGETMAGYLAKVKELEQSKRGSGIPPCGEILQLSYCERSERSAIRFADGQLPPLDRPPQNEQELRRWMDHTADPEAFARWLERAMSYTDPVEDSPCPEDTPSG